MVTSFSDFINHLIGARFSFTFVWELLVDLYNSILANENVISVWNTVTSFVSQFAWVLPYILMASGLIIAFFGKKMSGFLKFIGFFAVGFALGIHFLVPILPPEVPIPNWVIGIVTALVTAVLSKFLFVASCSVSLLYSVYRLCYHGFFLDHEPEFSSGKAVTALAIAVIILIITLVLFKFVEMAMFSALGAWMATLGFGFAFVDLGSLPKLGANSWILEVSVMGVIALIGFIFQVKTRRRY